MAAHWPQVTALIVDRQDIVSAQTRAGFAALGWKCASVTGDIFAVLPDLDAEIITANLWTLFSLYLKHVQDFKQSDQYTPLPMQLRSLIHTDTRELVVAAMLVTTAVEGALDLEFPHFGHPTKSFIDAVNATVKLLNRVKCANEELRRRAGGSLGIMKTPRAMDILKELETRGIVSKAMITSWRELRNASAHAAIDPSEFDTQTLWADCAIVGTMMHLLVFEAVGYKGYYSDCATKGWPVRKVGVNPGDGTTASEPPAPLAPH